MRDKSWKLTSTSCERVCFEDSNRSWSNISLKKWFSSIQLNNPWRFVSIRFFLIALASRKDKVLIALASRKDKERMFAYSQRYQKPQRVFQEFEAYCESNHVYNVSTKEFMDCFIEYIYSKLEKSRKDFCKIAELELVNGFSLLYFARRSKDLLWTNLLLIIFPIARKPIL